MKYNQIHSFTTIRISSICDFMNPYFRPCKRWQPLPLLVIVIIEIINILIYLHISFFPLYIFHYTFTLTSTSRIFLSNLTSIFKGYLNLKKFYLYIFCNFQQITNIFFIVKCKSPETLTFSYFQDKISFLEYIGEFVKWTFLPSFHMLTCVEGKRGTFQIHNLKVVPFRS